MVPNVSPTRKQISFVHNNYLSLSNYSQTPTNTSSSTCSPTRQESISYYLTYFFFTISTNITVSARLGALPGVHNGDKLGDVGCPLLLPGPVPGHGNFVPHLRLDLSSGVLNKMLACELFPHLLFSQGEHLFLLGHHDKLLF